MKHSGFSLIELLVVLAVVAILAALATPSYSQYIARENLRRAQADLELISLRLEHRYQRVLAYPIVANTNTAALKAALTGWTPTSDTSEFNFSNENATSSTYTLKATGLTGRVNGCVVSLTHDGTKSSSNCSNLIDDGGWL